MLTKSDCLSILVNLNDSGIEVNPMMRKLTLANEPPLEVLKFIVANRGVIVTDFYEQLRKKHNQHKSTLYTNLVKEDTVEEQIPIILSSLLTQICLYSKNLTQLERQEQFYQEARASEITEALQDYFISTSLQKCKALLHLIKADLLVLEYLADRRILQK